MDETYIKLKAKWDYLYRAVDKNGSNEAALILLSFYLMLLGLWTFGLKIDKLNISITRLSRIIALLKSALNP